MNRKDIKKVLDELTGDIDSIADKKVVSIIKTLVNLVEILAEANEQLRATNQQLKDEVNRLKGEQGKPDIRKQTKDGDNDKGNSDHSSEKNRNKGNGDKKRKPKNKKTETVRVDRQVTVEFDKTVLPNDAEFKGYEYRIIQDLKIITDNVEFKLPMYYSKSLKKTFIAPMALSQKIIRQCKIRGFAKERSTMISFKWRHFKQDIILMLVRWYVAYALSYRDVEELALERGLKVDHSTINRWVIKYAPLLEDVFRKRHKRPVGISWRMDETYIKVKGQWVYLYRAVDKYGQTVDFMLSEKRDEPAARTFFEKAIGSSGIPDKVTMDKSGANKAGIDTINLQLALLFMLGGLFLQVNVRQIKYLNNIVEQDHRFIKKITKPMKGFKTFHSAQATLSGIELHHMLRKGQHSQSANQTIFEQFYELAA